MISLVPPRNPNSNSAEDRRWHVIVSHGGMAEYTQLYGPRVDDAKAAQAEANRVLERNFTWIAKGKGFQADLTKQPRKKR